MSAENADLALSGEAAKARDGARQTAERMRARWGDAMIRAQVTCGQQVWHVQRDKAHQILDWLHDDPAEDFDYLTDLTAVEYRDPELPLEVVYQLRSLARKADLRVKIPLDPRGQIGRASC